jgi:fatty-acyl-CoA synthase
MMDFPLTLTHILERADRLFPEVQIVSRMPDRSLDRYTYADFYQRARALAEALQRLGLWRGDRVATLMWNHYVHLETLLRNSRSARDRAHAEPSAGSSRPRLGAIGLFQ